MLRPYSSKNSFADEDYTENYYPMPSGYPVAYQHHHHNMMPIPPPPEGYYQTSRPAYGASPGPFYHATAPDFAPSFPPEAPSGWSGYQTSLPVGTDYFTPPFAGIPARPPFGPPTAMFQPAPAFLPGGYAATRPAPSVRPPRTMGQSYVIIHLSPYHSTFLYG